MKRVQSVTLKIVLRGFKYADTAEDVREFFEDLFADERANSEYFEEMEITVIESE